MTINFIRVPTQSEACTCCTDADQEAALVKYGVNPRRVPTSEYHRSVMAYADKVLDRMEARKR